MQTGRQVARYGDYRYRCRIQKQMMPKNPTRTKNTPIRHDFLSCPSPLVKNFRSGNALHEYPKSLSVPRSFSPPTATQIQRRTDTQKHHKKPVFRKASAITVAGSVHAYCPRRKRPGHAPFPSGEQQLFCHTSGVSVFFWMVTTQTPPTMEDVNVGYLVGLDAFSKHRGFLLEGAVCPKI